MAVQEALRQFPILSESTRTASRHLSITAHTGWRSHLRLSLSQPFRRRANHRFIGCAGSAQVSHYEGVVPSAVTRAIS